MFEKILLKFTRKSLGTMRIFFSSLQIRSYVDLFFHMSQSIKMNFFVFWNLGLWLSKSLSLGPYCQDMCEI